MQHFKLDKPLCYWPTVVYTAIDERDNSTVLVKMGLPHDNRSEQVTTKSQIRNEYDILTGPLLGCPGVPEVKDIGATTYSCDGKTGGPAEVPVIVEYPVGTNIFLVDKHKLLDVGLILSDTLAEIHSRGVVHRDIKPGNIVMTEDGPLLIDFGLSHRVADRKGLAGSPPYVPARVFAGAPHDPAGDVESLLLTMHAMDTGVQEWEALKHPEDRPPFPSGGLAEQLKSRLDQSRLQPTQAHSDSRSDFKFSRWQVFGGLALAVTVTVLSRRRFKLW